MIGQAENRTLAQRHRPVLDGPEGAPKGASTSSRCARSRSDRRRSRHRRSDQRHQKGQSRSPPEEVEGERGGGGGIPTTAAHDAQPPHLGGGPWRMVHFRSLHGAAEPSAWIEDAGGLGVARAWHFLRASTGDRRASLSAGWGREALGARAADSRARRGRQASASGSAGMSEAGRGTARALGVVGRGGIDREAVATCGDPRNAHRSRQAAARAPMACACVLRASRRGQVCDFERGASSDWSLRGRTVKCPRASTGPAGSDSRAEPEPLISSAPDPGATEPRGGRYRRRGAERRAWGAGAAAREPGPAAA